MIKELFAKVYFQILDIYAQVYYPAFERQYIDPLTFKENKKGLVSFKSGNTEDSLILVLAMTGVILFVLLIILIINYFKKQKKKKSKVTLK